MFPVVKKRGSDYFGCLLRLPVYKSAESLDHITASTDKPSNKSYRDFSPWKEKFESLRSKKEGKKLQTMKGMMVQILLGL